MRVLFRLPIIVSVAVSAACAADLVTDPDVSSASDASTPDAKSIVTDSQSCFAGPYAQYETWLAHLANTEPRINVANLQRRISKARYSKAKERLDCQRIRYRVDDITVEGFTIRPKSSSEPSPVVIYNRGGNASHARIEFRTLFQRLFDLADQGFFVIASQYRGSDISPDSVNGGHDEFGGKDIEDVITLLDIVDESPHADGGRVGMLGWSRGAIMSFLAVTQTDRISALAVGGAPTDIVEELKLRPEMERVFEARIPDYERNKKTELERRSVLYWANELPQSVPVLILHGQDDKNVSVRNALELAEELQQQQIKYRLVIYESGNHSLLQQRDEVNREIRDWFKEKL